MQPEKNVQNLENRTHPQALRPPPLPCPEEAFLKLSQQTEGCFSYSKQKAYI